MVGVYLSVWVRRGILQHVRGVQVTYVGTGMMGYLGNKGQRLPCSVLKHYIDNAHLTEVQQTEALWKYACSFIA